MAVDRQASCVFTEDFEVAPVGFNGHDLCIGKLAVKIDRGGSDVRPGIHDQRTLSGRCPPLPVGEQLFAPPEPPDVIVLIAEELPDHSLVTSIRTVDKWPVR